MRISIVLIALAGCAHFNTAAIDAETRALMAGENVKGLALAIIDEGKVVHVAAFGQRNVEKALPLEPDTVMYGASLTKTVFSYFVMQLVDEKMLTLDTSIAELLPKPLPSYPGYEALEGDERWRVLTPRIILSHTSGLANFAFLEPDQKLRFHWQPGTRYGYSGEALIMLQLALEEGLKIKVGEEIQRRLFDRFGLQHTSLTWRDDFAANLADGYGIDGQFGEHDQRSKARVAGSMDTTIADQAKLWAALMRGDDLSPASRAMWVTPQQAISSRAQFPTLIDSTDQRGPAMGLSAGLGMLVFGNTWFKGGHNDFTGNMVVCQEAKRRCVVLLSNSVRAERIYPALVHRILGDTGMPWWWEYGLP